MIAELRALLAKATPGAGGGLLTDDEADLFAAWAALPALLDGMDAAREAAGLLYLARKRCACWGKMTGRCMTCDRFRDAEEAISAALVKLETP